MSQCENCESSACDGNSCQDDKYLLTRVKHVKADTDPCDPVESKNCAKTEPEFDVLEQDFILPGVGNNAPLYICNPTVYAVGQWLRLSGGTKVQVVGLGADHVVVRNACSDGTTAIVTNADPGAPFPKDGNIWLTEEPNCATVDACEGLLECLRTAEGICFSAIPDADPDEKLHLFGGTLLSDPCEDEQGDGLAGSCLRKLKRIFSFGGALCYPDIPEVDGNKDGENQKQFGVFRTGDDCGGGQENCFEKLAIGTDGVYRVCDGDIKFITNGRIPVLIERQELINETVQYNQISDFVRDLVLPNLPEDCGNGICVQIEGQAYALTGTSGDLFKFEFLVNGQEFLLLAGNEQVNASSVSFPGHQNGTTIVCGVDDNVQITTNVENGLASGFIELKVWATMYYV